MYFTHTYTHTHAESCAVLPRDFAASAAPASITIIAQSFVLLGRSGSGSGSGSVSQCLLQELTEDFQAAAADPVSSVQAPVDTVEQQAEHCQEAGRRNKRWREEFGRRARVSCDMS